ncbi:MAG TPA: hypothetical protein DDY31_07180 [Lachnospiraceae bacterium]|nr:hypothetical protein [Lachnospiraceae bacterium]
MVADKDPYIKSAYQALQVISQDKQKRLEYEAREKAIRDHNQFMYEARQKGMKEGIEIGEARGKTLAAIEIAKRLIGQGYSTNEVMLITNLPENQIDKLR